MLTGISWQTFKTNYHLPKENRWKKSPTWCAALECSTWINKQTARKTSLTVYINISKLYNIRIIHLITWTVWWKHTFWKFLPVIIILVVENLSSAVGILLRNVDQELENSLKKVNRLTSLICQCYRIDSDIVAPLFAVRIRFAYTRSDELNRYKTTLAFYLQYKNNLK